MKTAAKICSLLLCLVLALSVLSCTKDSQDPSDGTDQATPVAGLVTHGSFNREDLPDIPDLTEWIGEAVLREVQNSTLLYSRDPDDGLWHCWLYVSSVSGNAPYTFSAVDGTVTIRAEVADPDALGSQTVFYFTLSQDTEPDFELYLNGDYEGMLVVHADTSVKK